MLSIRHGAAPGFDSKSAGCGGRARARAWLGLVVLWAVGAGAGAEPIRAMRFQAHEASEARAWQGAARTKLFASMMGGGKPARVPLDAQVVRRVEDVAPHYTLEETSLASLPDRRVRAWVARPKDRHVRRGAVLALHGHGGSGEQVVRGQSLYWYGRRLAELGYVVIAPDLGQHELQHPQWSLMGERTWDALRCLDYVATLPEVDAGRMAVCGLSLGGETTMYVAALDERVSLACSSGWLTTVANMKNGHCPCFDFPGLEATFDFSDIFGCVAPRSLICEIGEQERAPGGFPVALARPAFEEVQSVYRVLGAEAQARLSIHAEGHVFKGEAFFAELPRVLGRPPAPAPPATPATR